MECEVKKLLKSLHVMAATDKDVTWQKHSAIAQIELERMLAEIIAERKRRGV